MLSSHCMWLLQACKAKPDKNVKELMLWSADRIMELISLLQSAYSQLLINAVSVLL